MDKELESCIKDALAEMFWAYTENEYTESESIDLVLGYLRSCCPNAQANPPKPTPVKDLVQAAQNLTRAVEKLDNSRQPDSVFESVCFRRRVTPVPGTWGQAPVLYYNTGPTLVALQTPGKAEPFGPTSRPSALRWNGTWYTKATVDEAEYLEKEYEQQ